MFKSETIKELAGALLKAQKEMDNAVLNKENNHFHNKYADLNSVRDAVVKLWNDNGIVVAQVPSINSDGSNPTIRTMLVHAASGEFIAGDYPIAGGRPQEMASAITYARRISASAMAFIAADEDDDANIAEGKAPKVIERAPPKPANDNITFIKLDPCLIPFTGNFTDWGARLAAQINVAPAEDHARWWNANRENLSVAEIEAPKIYMRLKTLFKVVQQNNKTGTTQGTRAKPAADDFDAYRLELLKASTDTALDRVWEKWKGPFRGHDPQDLDKAVAMLEVRRSQLKQAA